jgi:hypothetical protein
VNSAGNRFFSSVPLVRPEEPLCPEMVAWIAEVRASKPVRVLAKSAAFQLRYLVDVAAFEDLLNSAAMASAELGVDPRVWLQARIEEIKREQVISREEHSRITARIGSLAHEGGTKQTDSDGATHFHVVGHVSHSGVRP